MARALSEAMTNMAGSLIFVVLAVVAVWIIASLVGFNMALGPSLLLSIVLTVGMALVLGALRRR